jgi:hypothetical protein
MYKYPLPIIGAVLVLLTVFLAVWQFGTIKSTGIPLGYAARVPNGIVQIIRTQERYLPSLKRNPDHDRFRLDLLVVSLTEPTRQEMIALTRGQDRSALQPMTRILGAEKDLVWLLAPDLLAVNLKSKQVHHLKDLQRTNPELQLFLKTARFEFDRQLVAVSPDWQQAYCFAADTLRASACPPPPRTSSIAGIGAETPNGSLCSGGSLDPSNWFGVLAQRDATNSFKQGFSLPREFPLNPKDEARQLYLARLDANSARPRITMIEPASERTYRGAALLREAAGAGVLRLNDPHSVLMVHRLSGELNAPWMLVRITPENKTIWTVNTGIGTLKQLLPDPALVALIGERPPIANRVPESILVLIDTSTGATNTISLWR